jgi:hypothetical protein
MKALQDPRLPRRCRSLGSLICSNERSLNASAMNRKKASDGIRLDVERIGDVHSRNALLP